MKICVLAKRNSIINWAEAAVAAFRAAGHEVLHAVIRDPRIDPRVEALLFSPRLGAPRAAAIARRVRAFGPDLMLAVDAYSMPLSLLERLRAQPGLPPLIGWVGDRFAADYSRARDPFFSAVGYTDSGLLGEHSAFGLRSQAIYLPHAASGVFASSPASGASRRDCMAFIANPTRLRRATVAAIREPVALYGAGWKDFSTDLHERHAHRVLSEHVGAIYRHHFAVLNIRNEEHVIGGLNQRSFDPYLCGAAVVSDAQPDLARCFDPGVEVLVWHDTEELNAIYAGLRRQPALAAAVAERGERRVRHEHTYAHRLATIAALAGVRLQ